MAQELKPLQDEDKILIYTVSKFQTHICYILGDMIPPNQGSSLFQDSSLNMTPMENCNILGYKYPNEIFQDVPDRERTIISVVKILDPEGETMTRGTPYNFDLLNSPEISHLWKIRISLNW